MDGAKATFLGTLVRDERIAAGYMKHYVALPEDVAASFHVRERLVGTLDGHPFRRQLVQERDRLLQLNPGPDETVRVRYVSRLLSLGAQ